MAGKLGLRILYHALVEFRAHDGHSVHTRLVIDALRENGHEVIPVGPDCELAGGQRIPFRGYSKMRVRMYRASVRRRLTRWIEEHRPDVVVDKLSYALPEVVEACRRTGTRLVVEVNGALGDDALARSTWKGLRELDPASSLLLGVAHGLEPHYRVATSAPYATFENGAPEWTVDRDPALREKLGIPEDSKVVAFIGSPNPDYALEEMVQALEELQGEGRPVHLLGVGPDPLGAKLRSHLEGTSVPHTLIGAVPHAEISKYYALANIGFVVWRDHRCMAATAMKLREWLLTSVPPVCSGRSTWPDDHPLRAVATFTEGASVPEIVGALREVLDDEAQHRTLAARGETLIRESYSWRARAEEYVRTIQAHWPDLARDDERPAEDESSSPASLALSNG